VWHRPQRGDTRDDGALDGEENHGDRNGVGAVGHAVRDHEAARRIR
jgi:hypothetical protein